ncbi:MAG: hypothetical protein ABW022_25475 [Actinoplanes sp.]
MPCGPEQVPWRAVEAVTPGQGANHAVGGAGGLTPKDIVDVYAFGQSGGPRIHRHQRGRYTLARDVGNGWAAPP